MSFKKTKNGTYNTKNNTKPLKEDLAEAHDVGYALGWDHAHEIPKRFMAKTYAACGLVKGASHRTQTDSYIKKYKKKGTKYTI